MGYLGIGLGSFLAGFTQTVSGFAGGIMIALFANIFFDSVAAAAINNCICVILAPVILVPYIKKIQWKKVILPWIFYIPTSVTIVRHLTSINLGVLKLAFGIFLIVLALYFLLFANKVKIKPTLLLQIVFSVISGACQAMFAIGGPLMALYYSSILDDKEEYIATIQAFFSVTSVSALVTRIVSGQVSVDFLPYVIIGWVLLVSGRLLGKRTFERINGQTLKKIVYIVMIFAGVVNVVTQLSKML